MFVFIKNFLTVGDWSARVWSEDISESCLFWVNSGTEVSKVSPLHTVWRVSLDVD